MSISGTSCKVDLIFRDVVASSVFAFSTAPGAIYEFTDIINERIGD